MTSKPGFTYQPLDLVELERQIVEINAANGWHDTNASPLERIALIMTEASEAIEEIRDGHTVLETYYREDGKPEGVPSEIADVIIRALDFTGYYGIDIVTAIAEKLTYNATRGHRHGGKTI